MENIKLSVTEINHLAVVLETWKKAAEMTTDKFNRGPAYWKRHEILIEKFNKEWERVKYNK